MLGVPQKGLPGSIHGRYNKLHNYLARLASNQSPKRVLSLSRGPEKLKQTNIKNAL